MTKKKNLRKCAECGNDIDILKDEFLKNSGKYIHMDCFLIKEKSKGHSDDVINSKIELIKQKMNLEQEEIKQREIEKEKKKIKNTKDKIKENEFKKQFIEWVQSEYGITCIDKYTYIKLSNINNGTYKDLKEGISYEDLLYMFKKKKGYMDKVAHDKERKGQGFKSGLSRLQFDIAIIINQYDDYKQWKEKQKLLEVEQFKLQQDKNKEKIDYSKISNRNSIKENKGVDIDALLNDIY